MSVCCYNLLAEGEAKTKFAVNNCFLLFVEGAIGCTAVPINASLIAATNYAAGAQ